MKNLQICMLLFLFSACSTPAEEKVTKENGQKDMEQKMADPILLQLFEEVNVVKMHLFGTNEAMPSSEDYPYVGQAIEGDALSFLSPDLQPNDLGKVYACYYTENSQHFILRVPGKYASSDLALAKWDGALKKLVKVKDLAYLTCDEGFCLQQDAWLADLDDSRTLELIIRSQEKEMDGTIKEGDFTVMTDDGMGFFKVAGEQLVSLAVKDNYRMN